MQPTKIRSTTWVPAACMTAGAAFAQSPTPGDAARLPDAEVSFLKQAAQNGHTEVERGKLALREAAADAQVRQFAQMMVNDHQKAGEELKTIELFEEAAREVNSAEVKAFAAKALPRLQKHLSMARELHASRQGTADDGGERQGSVTGARQ